MDRREFVRGAALTAASVLAVGSVGAAIRPMGVINTPYGPRPVQQAYVQQPTRIIQQCDQWCWAASCAMIFSMWRHPFDQQQIVNRVFGGTICRPAPTGVLMAQVLSDRWTDMNGRQFQSTVTAAYDRQANYSGINNTFILNELMNNRPLLYANTHHAMVVVSADFIGSPMAPTILNVGVLDPWPGSPAYHPLSPPELVPAHIGGQMMFLAATRTN